VVRLWPLWLLPEREREPIPEEGDRRRILNLRPGEASEWSSETGDFAETLWLGCGSTPSSLGLLSPGIQPSQSSHATFPAGVLSPPLFMPCRADGPLGRPWEQPQQRTLQPAANSRWNCTADGFLAALERSAKIHTPLRAPNDHYPQGPLSPAPLLPAPTLRFLSGEVDQIEVKTNWVRGIDFARTERGLRSCVPSRSLAFQHESLDRVCAVNVGFEGNESELCDSCALCEIAARVAAGSARVLPLVDGGCGLRRCCW
jgi:hypothetical protein